MANKDELKEMIRSVFYNNNRKEITKHNLQLALLKIVNSL